MKRVDRVELHDVDEVEAHRPGSDDPDGVLGVMMGHRVDGVDLVLAVEVSVEGVHHHHELLPIRVFGCAEKAGASHVGLLRVSCWIRIDNECAVHPLVDVSLQWQGMAVVEVTTERKGIELVGEHLAGTDLASPQNTIHPCRMDAMKMDGMTMRTVVLEHDPHSVAFGDAQGRTGHSSVVGPGREEEPRRDLDFLVLAHDLKCPKRAAIWQG